MAMAIYMGAGPSVMYAAQALEAADQMTAKAASPEYHDLYRCPAD